MADGGGQQKKLSALLEAFRRHSHLRHSLTEVMETTFRFPWQEKGR